MTAQADFLTALAEHMRAHGLGETDRCAPSWNFGGGWDLHTYGLDDPHSDDRQNVPVIVAWARSFGMPEVGVYDLGQKYGHQVNVKFAAEIGGTTVEVWTTADWLRDALDLPEDELMDVPVAKLDRLSRERAERGDRR